MCDRMIFNFFCFRPADAKNRVELITKQLADQNISQKKTLPIAKCILEEAEKNLSVIDITVSHVRTIPLICFIQFIVTV